MTYIIPEEAVAPEIESPYDRGASDVILTVLFALLGIVLGSGVYAYLDNCSGLTCGDRDTASTVATEGEVVVDVSYTPPTNVPAKDEFAGWNITFTTEDLSGYASEQIPTDYLQDLNNVLVAAAELELQLREVVPESLYAIQDIAAAGELDAIFAAVVKAQTEAVNASDLNNKFGMLLNDLESSNAELDESLMSQSAEMIVRGRSAMAVATEFIDLAVRLSEPKPPAQSDIDSVLPLSDAVKTSFTQFSDSVEETITLIKSSGE